MAKINVLDGGTVEERIRESKEFLGLRPDQTFQDLDVGKHKNKVKESK